MLYPLFFNRGFCDTSGLFRAVHSHNPHPPIFAYREADAPLFRLFLRSWK